MHKNIDKLNKSWFSAGAVLFLVAVVFLKYQMPPPHVLLHSVQCYERLPPLWLLGLLWYGSYALMGGALGHTLSLKHISCENNGSRYLGAFLLLLAAILGAVWYMLLFGKQAVLFSWLLMGIGLAMLGGGVYVWTRVSKMAVVCLIGVLFVHILLWITQLFVMLHI